MNDNLIIKKGNNKKMIIIFSVFLVIIGLFGYLWKKQQDQIRTEELAKYSSLEYFKEYLDSNDDIAAYLIYAVANNKAVGYANFGLKYVVQDNIESFNLAVEVITAIGNKEAARRGEIIDPNYNGKLSKRAAEIIDDAEVRTSIYAALKIAFGDQPVEDLCYDYVKYKTECVDEFEVRINKHYEEITKFTLFNEEQKIELKKYIDEIKKMVDYVTEGILEDGYYEYSNTIDKYFEESIDSCSKAVAIVNGPLFDEALKKNQEIIENYEPEKFNLYIDVDVDGLIFKLRDCYYDKINEEYTFESIITNNTGKDISAINNLYMEFSKLEYEAVICNKNFGNISKTIKNGSSVMYTFKFNINDPGFYGYVETNLDNLGVYISYDYCS